MLWGNESNATVGMLLFGSIVSGRVLDAHILGLAHRFVLGLRNKTSSN